MSLPLLQTALLLPLEFVVNGVLALDAASSARLAKLSGRTLALHSTQPQARLFITVRDKGLHLTTIFEGDPSASLHGPASALLGLLLRRDKVSNLHSRQLELRGSTAFVQELQALLLDLDLDWEYHLGKIFGDMPTQALSTGLREAGAFLKKSGSRLKADAVDYLQEESRLFPATAELDAFYNAVSALALRVDRLQARLYLLGKAQA
jgi:ubiquinone biosynthesis protein UbiJ